MPRRCAPSICWSASAEPGARLNLAFLGGEPLVNREVLRAATRTRRWNWPSAAARTITFSITTNGTLLTEDDGRFFEEHGFAVTVSLDGPREVHDALRPFKGGGGSLTRHETRAPLLKHAAEDAGFRARHGDAENLVVAPDAR